MVINSEKFRLEILDTAGADEYLHLRDRWIRSNEGFILVYSISSKSSFIRIQGLYDQIQQVKKSPHPHTSFHVPIILVGNKDDMVEREVSLLEGKEIARILGCRFVEASAKDGGNVEDSFYAIMRQMEKLCKEKALLNELITSLPVWYNFLDKLESEISLSQIELAKANASTHARVHAMNIVTEQPDTKKLPTQQLFRVNLSTLLASCQRSFPRIKISTLQLPRLIQRQRSFPGINSCQPLSRPRLISPKRMASSVDCLISRPLEHPDRSVPEGNYNSLVQNAFGDIIRFLSIFGRKIRSVGKQARLAEVMARAVCDIEDNYTGGEASGLEIREKEGMTPVAKVDEIDIVQDVLIGLDKCQKLCEDAAFEVIQRGESRDKIQEMKN